VEETFETVDYTDTNNDDDKNSDNKKIIEIKKNDM
jgi:hypothetical protein